MLLNQFKAGAVLNGNGWSWRLGMGVRDFGSAAPAAQMTAQGGLTMGGLLGVTYQTTVTIEFNSNADSDFITEGTMRIGNFGTTVDANTYRAILVIHELGHAVDALYGAETSAINETPENLVKIWENCFK